MEPLGSSFFCGFYLESCKIIPKRSYLGAYGYQLCRVPHFPSVQQCWSSRSANCKTETAGSFGSMRCLARYIETSSTETTQTSDILDPRILDISSKLCGMGLAVRDAASTYGSRVLDTTSSSSSSSSSSEHFNDRGRFQNRAN